MAKKTVAAYPRRAMSRVCVCVPVGVCVSGRVPSVIQLHFRLIEDNASSRDPCPRRHVNVLRGVFFFLFLLNFFDAVSEG